MTHVTRINTAAFERLASFLEGHPDNYDQAHYFEITDHDIEFAGHKPLCGSTGCLAGWTCVNETEDFERHGLAMFPKPETMRREFGVDVHHRPLDRMNHIASVYDDWTSAYFFRTAREVLGLNLEEATHLFHSAGRPKGDLTVSEAMHKIAMGADIFDVWTIPYRDVE